MLEAHVRLETSQGSCLSKHRVEHVLTSVGVVTDETKFGGHLLNTVHIMRATSKLFWSRVKIAPWYLAPLGLSLSGIHTLSCHPQ